MPYKHIIYIRLEKRLLNDHRWFTMSNNAQLLYIKLLLLLAHSDNKITKDDILLTQLVRSDLEIGVFRGCLQEIKKNFPKFKANKYFYYMDNFEDHTNYIPKEKRLGNPKEIPRMRYSNSNSIVIEKNSNIEEKPIKPAFSFEEIYFKYPSKVGKKAAERHFQSSVKTPEDFALINTALDNYLKSDRVAKGFIQNASTWFLNWKDWIKVQSEYVDLRTKFGLKKE